MSDDPKRELASERTAGKASRIAKRHQRELIPKMPGLGTRAALEYYLSCKKIFRFYYFLPFLAGTTDARSKIAHEALLAIEDDQEKRDAMIAEWKTRRGAIDELRENRQFFIEIIFVRHVENFLNYLSGILFEIFTQRPETLRSGDKVDVASILKHESIESLVRELAERRVESLSYSSFRDMSEFFRDRFGLPIGTDSELKSIVEAIEIRNISVHNRCIVNKRFVARLSLEETEIGKQRDLFPRDLEVVAPLLLGLVKSLDKKLSGKLRLRRVRFQDPTK